MCQLTWRVSFIAHMWSPPSEPWSKSLPWHKWARQGSKWKRTGRMSGWPSLKRLCCRMGTGAQLKRRWKENVIFYNLGYCSCFCPFTSCWLDLPMTECRRWPRQTCGHAPLPGRSRGGARRKQRKDGPFRATFWFTSWVSRIGSSSLLYPLYGRDGLVRPWWEYTVSWSIDRG